MLLDLFSNFLPSPPPVLEEKKRKESFEIAVGERTVPVHIFFEERFNHRVVVNHKGITLRINQRVTKEEQRKNIDRFLQWAKDKLGEKPEILEYLPQRKYVNGEVFRVGKYDFYLTIFTQAQKKSTARIYNNQIAISLANGLTDEARQSTTSYLVARCLTKFFLPIVRDRIYELNQRYFGKTINAVKLKYNVSNWGSCSTQGNINISLRLMFAPDDVIDYVLIHELAHLVHANHSTRFWNLVEKIMPNYAEKEKHLTANNLKYYL